MKKTHIFSLLIFILAVLFTLSLRIIFRNDNDKPLIPERPLIIVGSEIVNLIYDGSAQVQYKTVDKNGNVFYFNEKIEFREQPKRLLGDTIK